MNKFYIYPGNNSYLLREALLRRGNWQEETEDPNPFMHCNFIWKPTNLTINEYIKLDGVSKAHPKNFHQVFNHFENIRGICTKTGLVRSLKKYYHSNAESRQVNYTIFDSTPTSFLLTAGVDDTEYTNFVARYREIVKQSFSKECIPAKHCEANMWLVKPANLNQGRGIEVFKSLKDINSFLYSRPHNSFWVVQKYIERPLLYLQRKFDIRVWVVVTNKQEIFMYKTAYLRTSSDDYDIKADKNYVHLTNNCLQKYGENYGKHEDGNTLDMHKLDEYIKEQYPAISFSVDRHIVPRMKDLIIDTILCTKKNLNPLNRKGVFELFGYDFLVDEDLRTWLIEVNTNPYLGIPNKFIAKVLPEMLDDMLEITLDPLFPPKTPPRDPSRPNNYELIYCDNNSTHHNGPLNQRSTFTRNVYPIQSLIPQDFGKKLVLTDKNHDLQYNPSTIPSKSTKNGNAKKQAAGDKVGSDNNLQQVEGEDPIIEDGGIPLDVPRRASSADPKGVVKDQGRNNIEQIHKQLCLMMVYKTDMQSNYVNSQVGRVLSCLKNWELLSNREVNLACKTLTLIAHSAGAILVEQANIVTLAKLLKSSDVKTEIKFAVIEAINILSKDINQKKKLICNHLLHNLINLCLSSCDEKEIQNHNKNFLMATLKCLINLGGVFNRKLYIPGETRDAARLRSFFLAQGGISAIWIAAQKALDPDMREYAQKNFLSYLEFCDWERQLQAVDLLLSLQKGGAPELNKHESAAEQPAQEVDNEALQAEAELIFYRTIEIAAVEKVLQAKAEAPEKELEKVIDFPKSVFKVMSLETMKKGLADYVAASKEAYERREVEEREKRQQAEVEKQKKAESRKKELDEQRKNALESFEKRIKQNLRKQQMDLERRQREVEAMKHREAEERRRNIENLMNKKAEREKKQVRVRTLRNPLKKGREDMSHEDLQDNGGVADLKTSKLYNPAYLNSQKSAELNRAEKDRMSLKNFANATVKVEVSKESLMVDLDNATRKTSNSVERMGQEKLNTLESKREITVENQKENQERENTQDVSPKQIQNLKQQMIVSAVANSMNQQINPRGSHNESELKAGGNSNVQALSESENDMRRLQRDKDNNDNNSNSNFKLPKIQKAGRLLMSQKFTNSPYLKDLQDPLGKFKVKKMAAKDQNYNQNSRITAERRREMDTSPITAYENSPYKGKVL